MSQQTVVLKLEGSRSRDTKLTLQEWKDLGSIKQDEMLEAFILDRSSAFAYIGEDYTGVCY